MHVTSADVPAAKDTTRLPPDELTVTAPELALAMKNLNPSTSVEVTGSTTVCVVVPVKYC
jgi:hypothetical protein